MVPTRSSLFSIIRVVYDLIKKDKSTPASKLYANGNAPQLIPRHWKEIKIGCGLTKHHLATGFTGSMITVFTTLLSCFLYQVALVFDINGSTAGCAVAFVIPPLLYIRCKTRPDIAVNLDRKRVIMNIPPGQPIPGEEPEEEWEEYESEEEVTDHDFSEDGEEYFDKRPSANGPPSDQPSSEQPANEVQESNDVPNPTQDPEPEPRPKKTKKVKVTRRRRVVHQLAAPKRVHQIDVDGPIGGTSHNDGVMPTQSRMGLLAAQSPAITPQPGYGYATSPSPDATNFTVEMVEAPAYEPTADSTDASSFAGLSGRDSAAGIEPSPSIQGTEQYRSKAQPFYLPDNPADDDMYQKPIRKYLVKHKKSEPKIVIAYLVMVLGIVLGLIALAMAIIYDTDLKNKISF
ncbi:hypothetical protein BLNAU_9801 [Blattamonas nauphoetae]|uniref:Amino acid transporter transmembrane domain-containing protein n=1 Tax=Blattamonas nauphoetae TaxID=2049346 RepID=A0ABQ9XUU8_9EUKA|nr:hypothetical protein BLNAU_9801 [Blattamonas nauphoetae]